LVCALRGSPAANPFSLYQIPTLAREQPPDGLSAPLAALWWDANGDWSRAHALVDGPETTDGMAVHAYVRRKGGPISNAEYWYERAGTVRRPTLDAEWTGPRRIRTQSVSEMDS
jgi:hypothetical protein